MPEKKIRHFDKIQACPKDIAKEVYKCESFTEAAAVLKDAIVEEAIQIKCGFQTTLSNLTNITAAYVDYSKAAANEVDGKDF